MSTISRKRQQIASSLRVKEHRDAFVASQIKVRIPFQIRAMREARGWTQAELGERVGMMQETISVLENVSYGKFTLNTLRRLAKAFDVGLMVRFVPFSQLVDWAADATYEDLAVPSYEQERDLSDADTYLDVESTSSAIPVI